MDAVGEDIEGLRYEADVSSMLERRSPISVEKVVCVKAIIS